MAELEKRQYKLADEPWSISLFKWLAKRIDDGKCKVTKGKRQSVSRVPDHMDPKGLDAHLQKFTRVADIHDLALQWMALPDNADNLSSAVKEKLLQQVSLYKRGSLARVTNANKNRELIEHRKREKRLNFLIDEAERTRQKLKVARNIAQHTELNENREAQIRDIKCKTPSQQYGAKCPDGVPGDLFDDLFEVSSQEQYQGARSQTE